VVHAAVTSQLATLGHVSNFFASPAQITLAERLLALLGQDGRVFFTNSGTEANEAAFKATRRTGRTKIISTIGAFHGRSMGALALTWKPGYREPFEPLPGNVEFIPYGDVAALAAALDDQTAAVIVEPIQGENGIIEPPAGYLAAARQLTTQHGALLWIDEVQTGIGRTGKWFAHSDIAVVPDLVTLAKGLGSGFPIGACIGVGSSASLLGPGDHGTTFGGNPVAAMAGLATLGVIERDGLLANATAVGDHLAEQIVALGHPLVEAVSGQGLLRGIQLNADIAAEVVKGGLEHGFIINAPTPATIRLAPPLIINTAQVDTFVAALPALLDAVQPASRTSPPADKEASP
jgi:acetylornithine aminotransferase